MRVLVAGWWSFLHGEATAGDLAAGAAAAAWLTRAGVPHDVARSPVLGGPPPDQLDPGAYTHLLFVCGPAAGRQVAELCERFAGCRRIAVGVSDPDGDAASRFDLVLARDGPGRPPTPDLSWAEPPTPSGRWPLVAAVWANPQPEYGDRQRHEEVHAALEAWLASRPLAVVRVDTRVDPRLAAQRDGAQLDSVLAAADVVVTTRLHGMVLALRAGTPAIAVDPVAGGAKVTAQAGAVGWPAVLPAQEAEAATLDRLLAWCRSSEAAGAVASSAARAAAGSAAVEASLLDALGA